MDVLRLGRGRLAHRLRLSDHLYRAGADGRPVLPADHPHRAARQGPEHHLDRRLHRGALRQEPGGRGDGGDDRHRRHDPLYRAAAQSGVVVGRNHPGRNRRRQCRGAAAPRRHRAVRRHADGGVRGAVRHAPYRRHRAPGRPDAGDRDRVDRQAGGVSRRRHLRHLRAVSRAAGPVHAGFGAAAHRSAADAGAAADGVRRHDRAVAVRHSLAAAPVPRRRGRKSRRDRDPPRRLDVPALSCADQSVRGADRDRRTADVSGGRRRRRHVRPRAAAQGALGNLRAHRVRRRPIGGDRHGDHGIGGARHHGVERHRDAARAQAPSAADGKADRRRRRAPHHPPHRHLRHPFVRLCLLPLGRRGAARLDRIPLVCRHRAIRAGVLRRPDLAARHRARRHRRHDRRHSGVGLYAVAAERLRRRHDRRAHPHRRAVRPRAVTAASAVRPRSAAAGARRPAQPLRQFGAFYRRRVRAAPDRDRTRPGGRVRAVDARPDRAEFPAAARRGQHRGIDLRPSPAISARSAPANRS